MMRKVLSFLILSFFLFAEKPVFATSHEPTPTPGWDNCMINGAPTIKCAEVVFADILRVVVTLAGIALFIMLVVGSFRFLTSGGDPKQTELARKTMTSAILGLVLIVGSYLILKLISDFTGIPELLKFEIPTF